MTNPTSTAQSRMPSPGTHPPIGSDEWEAQRLAAWRRNAATLVADLRKYEDEHPKDAPCFLDILGQVLSRVNGE